MDELTDDLVEAVLLRLPPAEPACLVRAAVVCRRWCRLISDPGFRRRFGRTRFSPASSFRPPYADVPERWTPVNARHCRVLFHDVVAVSSGNIGPELTHHHEHLVVSSPITGNFHRLPMPRLQGTEYCYWSAALLCCTAAGCDHLDHDGTYVVVTVVTDSESDKSTSACIYSLETGTWRPTVSIEHSTGSVTRGRPAFAGNALYFDFLIDNGGARILEYDLGKQELSLIDLPSPPDVPTDAFLLGENGGKLGITVVVRSTIYVWSRELTSQNGWIWAQQKVIELQSFAALPGLYTASTLPQLVAFVDGINVLSVKIPYIGVFIVHIKSGVVTKVGELFDGFIVPYMSFYIPRGG
ncbi:hypothetical protein BS78_02G099400 [Paspalum vaginatum]|nr:hypothetical protein BS78_02G099400 [Paspalum vaginatum]